MAAGLGFKDFTTGEVLTAADVDGYLMQGIWVFASTAARDAAVTAPSEGNFAFTKDTNSLWYYDGATWVASGATGDIEGVTAGVGISGGGTSGTVTITNSMATAIDAKGDLVPGTGADTFAKLSVGANNTVLTADSAEATGMKWATPSGAATSFTRLVNGTTLSGGSTTFTGLSGQNKLLVFVRYASINTANQVIQIRLNGDSGGNYYLFEGRIIPPSTYGTTITSNDAELGGTRIYWGTTSSNTSSSGAGYLVIDGANSTGAKTFTYASGFDNNGGQNSSGKTGGGYYVGTSVISSIEFTPASGSFTGGGIYIYGGN